eukprot:CAMPEP_0201875888 /NCGR_PEP_ID=MMETSP0902-20130614/7737_1 /ASSEMBLY_ACC=CAM_ASM_000551 /TAXON_ID=420261 /ORGANISM="Thalassiosira antarctica, Strain CCMP982" /LENGTH=487 /DNA_ID=CAMNT_0048403031 /DNA_START=113 /DNA_END=1574 /DNA_ORIENTATION=-
MTTFHIAIFLLFLLVASSEETDMWSKCDCPANDPNYDAAQDRPPSARIAYLISVHNRRTIQDGAYLLKALMETSHPGDTAIILIHVDKRVGIASRDVTAEKEEEENQFLYHDSSLKRYVDACFAAPACTRNKRNAMNSKSSNNATILEEHSHFSPEWSKWSMNDPTLWAMDYLTHHTQLNRQHGADQSWDVFINLSGDTLPVVTAQRISQLFEPLKGPLGSTNFVTSASCVTGLIPTSIFDFPKHSMKRAHYFQKDIPKTLSYVDAVTGTWKKDVETPIYFGSQWMALTHDFVEYVIRSMEHPNGLGNVLKETLIETTVLMTDETFFATMLMNSPTFKDTIPQLNDDGALESYPTMYSLRYERMDENAPNAWGEYTSSNPLYDIPTKFGKATGGEGPAKPWGPYFLGTYDLGSIRDSGALFVRKVSWAVDNNLVRMLPVKSTSGRKDGKLEWDELPDIRWPAELGVKIKDPFVWKKKRKKKKKKKNR